MLGYQPAVRRAFIGQDAPAAPVAPIAPTPSPVPVPIPVAAPVPIVAAPAPMSPGMKSFLETLKWAAIGFAAGGVTGYALGKTGILGSGTDKAGGLGGGLLGGLGGLAASVLPKLIGG